MRQLTKRPTYVVAASTDNLTRPTLTARERRAKRMDALMKMRDLWDKSNPGTGPIDGVEYQIAMRVEW